MYHYDWNLTNLTNLYVTEQLSLVNSMQEVLKLKIVPDS